MSHDGYLKLYTDAMPRIRGYDALLIDEAQDLAPATVAIVQAQDGLQRIVVGDESQSIYGFRGAVNAMRLFGGKRLSLSQSFRFGPSIARIANSVLAQSGRQLALQGLGGPSRVSFRAPDGDYAFLSRTNAGAVLAAVESEAARVHFAGGLAAYLVERMRDAGLLARGQRRLVRDAEFSRFSSLGALEAYGREIADVEILAVVGLVKQLGTDLERVLDDLGRRAVEHPREADFTVATAHKVKGLEYDNVALGPFFDWEEYVKRRDRGLTRDMVEELNLLYVAATRARCTLFGNETLRACWREFDAGAGANAGEVAAAAV